MIFLAVLLLANLAVAAYLMFGRDRGDFHDTFGVPEDFRDVSGERAEVRPDTPIPFPSTRRDTRTGLPSRYGHLESRGLFHPPGERPASEFASVDDPEQILPKPAGFRLIGRVENGSGRAFGVLRRLADGRIFVVPEGETVGDGSIRVVDVAETHVILSRPGRPSSVLSLPEADVGEPP